MKAEQRFEFSQGGGMSFINKLNFMNFVIPSCGGISHRTSENDPEKENQEPAPLSEQPLRDESQMPSYEQIGMDGCDFYTPNEDDDLPF